MTYKEHTINQSNNHIHGWYIDTDLCTQVIEQINKPQNKLGLISRNNNIHNYSSILLSKLSNELNTRYKSILLDLLALYVQEFPYLVSMELKDYLTIDTVPNYPDLDMFQVQKYQPDKFYSALHCENLGVSFTNKRAIAFMTYLNTIDEGGGTDFPYQKFTCNAEQGLTLFWPAYWTHPHIGVVAPKETKYIITGWVVCKEWA